MSILQPRRAPVAQVTADQLSSSILTIDSFEGSKLVPMQEAYTVFKCWNSLDAAPGAAYLGDGATSIIKDVIIRDTASGL